jgi:hypothetical protein
LTAKTERKRKRLLISPLHRVLDTSAWVGSLLVPARSLERHLGGFANSLTVWTHDELYKISLRGSAIGLIYCGKPLLVCSKHQLQDCELSDVGLMLPDGSNLVTSSGSREFKTCEQTQESDAFDVVAFNFSEPYSDFPLLRRSFFSFDSVPPDTHNSSILAFVLAGFPSRDQKYELEDKNHLGNVRRVLVAEPDGQPSDPSLLRLRFVETLDFDPDGLSGGPAFVVQIVGGEAKVFLGGMIVRAGASHCHILKSGFLWQFLSSFVTDLSSYTKGSDF